MDTRAAKREKKANVSSVDGAADDAKRRFVSAPIERARPNASASSCYEMKHDGLTPRVVSMCGLAFGFTIRTYMGLGDAPKATIYAHVVPPLAHETLDGIGPAERAALQRGWIFWDGGDESFQSDVAAMSLQVLKDELVMQPASFVDAVIALVDSAIGLKLCDCRRDFAAGQGNAECFACMAAQASDLEAAECFVCRGAALTMQRTTCCGQALHAKCAARWGQTCPNCRRGGDVTSVA